MAEFPKKLGTEEYATRFSQSVGKEFNLMTSYVNARTKITIKHSVVACGYEFEQLPGVFLKKPKCPKCDKRVWKPLITTEEFREMFEEASLGEYELLSEYLGMSRKIKIRHLNELCEYHEFEMTASNFVHIGQGCPKCYGRVKKTHEEIVIWIADIVGDEYEVASEYLGMLKPITLIHVGEDGDKHNYQTTPQAFIHVGNRCSKCYSRQKTHKQFLKEVCDRVGEEYEVLSEYKGAKEKVTFRHRNTSCGEHVFEKTPNDFLRIIGPRRCPKCGEMRKRKAMKEWKDKYYARVKGR